MATVGPGGNALNHANYTGSPYTGLKWDSLLCQQFRHPCGGFVFLEPKFGVLVDGAPDGDHFLRDFVGSTINFPVVYQCGYPPPQIFAPAFGAKNNYRKG